VHDAVRSGRVGHTAKEIAKVLFALRFRALHSSPRSEDNIAFAYGA
jgi:hypothetical protein